MIKQKENVFKDKDLFKFLNKSFELKVLTPQDLKQFKIDKKYMRQVDASHVEEIYKNYKNYYKNSSFCQYTFPIAVSVRNNGSKIIIDGQHRTYAAIKAEKSIFAIFYYGLSLEEEILLYVINNNIKMQSTNHKMDLMARLDENVKKVYDILDDNLIGWDISTPTISRLDFVSGLFLSFLPSPKKDIKKISNLLEQTQEKYFLYFDQLLKIAIESCSYDISYNNNKRKYRDLKAKTFWHRAILYQAVLRFIVIYHMRFGNNFKSNEKICNFISKIENWEEIYKKGKLKRQNSSCFYIILNEIIDLYNKGKRNVELMIPNCNQKLFDPIQYKYRDNYFISKKMLETEQVKLEKNKIKKIVKNKEFIYE